jgi:predicted RNA binding protein YcfA (HicA-like mRNA interferase family)
MSRLARLQGKEFIRILEKLGLEVVRSRGSRFFLRHTGWQDHDCSRALQ